MKKTFSIIGSCVTRDALEFLDNIAIENYLSRTSCISMVSGNSDNKINISTELNGFLYRTLTEDINKTHFKILEKTTSDFIIIDFIDERFPLLKSSDDKYITYSHYMESHTNALDVFTEKIPRLTMENLSLWIQSAKVFVKKLKLIYRDEQIIIHEAYWAGNDIQAERNNTYLSIYYNFLKILLPKSHIIRVEEVYRKMNLNHKWGIAPYHYIDNYYQNFASKLIKINDDKIQSKINTSLNKGIN